MSFPSIDHGLLSPNGRMSKRARQVAMAREVSRLFPPGYWDKPVPTEREQAIAKRDALLRHAATLRTCCPDTKKYRKLIEQAETEAHAIVIPMEGA